MPPPLPSLQWRGSCSLTTRAPPLHLSLAQRRWSRPQQWWPLAAPPPTHLDLRRRRAVASAARSAAPTVFARGDLGREDMRTRAMQRRHRKGYRQPLDAQRSATSVGATGMPSSLRPPRWAPSLAPLYPRVGGAHPPPREAAVCLCPPHQATHYSDAVCSGR